MPYFDIVFTLPTEIADIAFRRPMIEKLEAAHAAGKLAFFGALAISFLPERGGGVQNGASHPSGSKS